MPTFDNHDNLAYSLVATAPSPASSGTSLIVTAGQGTRFSSPASVGSYNATVWPIATIPTPANAEIVRITGKSTDTLTITRTQEGTNARSITVGDQIAVTITKKVITDIETALNNLLTTSLVTGEAPGGSINSSNTTFTTAAAFVSGSLRVFLNGQRLKGGGADYTESGSLTAFTMVVAPDTGDVLLVDYNTSTGTFAVGSTSLIYNEVPSGSVNGSNTTFTLSRAYVSGSTMVFRDGQLMTPGGADYTETTPGSGIITFTVAPETGSVITISYQYAVSVTGNADTVDGFHAADLLGWLPFTVSLSYSSADSPVFVASASGIDFTTFLSKGMRVKLNQTTDKYFIIVDLTATTLTLYGGTDYTLANATITSAYWSPHKAPFGFPLAREKWTVTVTDVTQRGQGTPSSGTWYNLGGAASQISVPIGSWDLGYSGCYGDQTAGTNTDLLFSFLITLSTANNSESNTNLTSGLTEERYAVTGGNPSRGPMLERRDSVTVTSKTTYYLLYKNNGSSNTPANAYYWNANVKNIISARCAYL